MPWASKKQAAWGHSVGMKELGAAKVAEFDRASRGLSLPTRVKPKRKKRKSNVLKTQHS